MATLACPASSRAIPDDGTRPKRGRVQHRAAERDPVRLCVRFQQQPGVYAMGKDNGVHICSAPQ